MVRAKFEKITKAKTGLFNNKKDNSILSFRLDKKKQTGRSKTVLNAINSGVLSDLIPKMSNPSLLSVAKLNLIKRENLSTINLEQFLKPFKKVILKAFTFHSILNILYILCHITANGKIRERQRVKKIVVRGKPSYGRTITRCPQPCNEDTQICRDRKTFPPINRGFPGGGDDGGDGGDDFFKKILLLIAALMELMKDIILKNKKKAALCLFATISAYYYTHKEELDEIAKKTKKEVSKIFQEFSKNNKQK